MTKRYRHGLILLRGGGMGEAPEVDEDAVALGLVGEEGLAGLSDAELGTLLLRYVLLPQALEARCNTLLYEVVYRLLGQRQMDETL